MSNHKHGRCYIVNLLHVYLAATIFDRKSFLNKFIDGIKLAGFFFQNVPIFIHTCIRMVFSNELDLAEVAFRQKR